MGLQLDLFNVSPARTPRAKTAFERMVESGEYLIGKEGRLVRVGPAAWRRIAGPDAPGIWLASDGRSVSVHHAIAQRGGLYVTGRAGLIEGLGIVMTVGSLGLDWFGPIAAAPENSAYEELKGHVTEELKKW